MRTPLILTWIVSICLFLAFLATSRVVAQDVQADCHKLRAAISDLTETFPDRYRNASHYVQRLDQIEERLAHGDKSAASDLESLRRVALPANPLIRDMPGLLLVLYLPHTMAHVPMGVSEDFQGKSRFGLYGDVIQCSDYHVGRVFDELDRQGIADNTLVVYASDNGRRPGHRAAAHGANRDSSLTRGGPFLEYGCAPAARAESAGRVGRHHHPG